MFRPARTYTNSDTIMLRSTFTRMHRLKNLTTVSFTKIKLGFYFMVLFIFLYLYRNYLTVKSTIPLALSSSSSSSSTRTVKNDKYPSSSSSDYFAYTTVSRTNAQPGKPLTESSIVKVHPNHIMSSVSSTLNQGTPSSSSSSSSSLPLLPREFLPLNRTVNNAITFEYIDNYQHDIDLVVARYNEPIEWLYHFLNDTRFNRSWQLILLNRETPTNPLTLYPNVGYEAYPFIRYIARNYFNLPPRVIFIHGHQYAFHIAGYDMLPILRALNTSKVYANINFGHYYTFTRMDYHTGKSYDRKVWTEELLKRYISVAKVWNSLGWDAFLGPIPDTFGIYCCASLLLSRDLIRRLPYHFWAYLDQWYSSKQFLQDPLNLSDKEVAFVFEIVFPFLFHGQAIEYRIRDVCKEKYLNCQDLPLETVKFSECCTGLGYTDLRPPYIPTPNLIDIGWDLS